MSDATQALAGEWDAEFWLSLIDAVQVGMVVGAILAFLWIIARNSQSLVVLARDVRQTLVVRDAKRYGEEHA